MPAPFLVSPPSVALSPPIVLWTSGCAAVTLKPLVSMIAPPLRTLAVVRPCRNVALVAAALSVPPLKLKVPEPPPRSSESWEPSKCRH